MLIYVHFYNKFSEHSISHRLPCSHAVWILALDGNLLNLVNIWTFEIQGYSRLFKAI